MASIVCKHAIRAAVYFRLAEGKDINFVFFSSGILVRVLRREKDEDG